MIFRKPGFYSATRLNKRLPLLVVSLLVLSSLLAACGTQNADPVQSSALPTLASTPTPVPAAPVGNLGSDDFNHTTAPATLVGSGSTFAQPIYTQWLNPDDPKSFIKTSPSVKISYQSIGSGSGRKALLSTPVPTANNITPTVPTDFAGSDSPFNAIELQAAASKTTAGTTPVAGQGQLVHIPTAIGGVVAIYNLKSVSHLNLSGPTLAAIFLGKITTWNDPAIQTDNPGVSMPSEPIIVVIRQKTSGAGSDITSGTSDIFTRYLSVVSDDFRKQFTTNADTSSVFKWAIKTTAEGGTAMQGNSNDDIVTAVKGGDGRIGYVDQGVADADQLTYAAIRNKTGRFISPTLANVSAAATNSFIPDDFRTYIVDAEGSDTYPIVGFTWLITWRELDQLPAASKDKATALTTFLWWAIHDGQADLPAGYAPLPASLIPRLERLFVTEKSNNPVSKVFLFQGQPVFTQP